MDIFRKNKLFLKENNNPSTVSQVLDKATHAFIHFQK